MKNKLLLGIVLSVGLAQSISADLMISHSNQQPMQVTVIANDMIKTDTVNGNVNRVLSAGSTSIVKAVIIQVGSDSPFIIKNLSYDMNSEDVMITVRTNGEYTITVINQATGQMTGTMGQAEPYNPEEV